MAGEEVVRLADGVADTLRRRFDRHAEAFGAIRAQVSSIVEAIEDGTTQFTPQMGEAPAAFGISWEDAALRVERSCDAVSVTVNRFSVDLSALEGRHAR